MKTHMPQRRFVWIAIVALVLLHHDMWFWQSEVVVLGFMPVGMAYHVAFSIAAAALWLVAIRWAWPSELEAWADEPVEDTHA